jgi:predicted permease
MSQFHILLLLRHNCLSLLNDTCYVPCNLLHWLCTTSCYRDKNFGFSPMSLVINLILIKFGIGFSQVKTCNDDNNFNISIVLIAFYGFIFLPQYNLKTNCKPKDDLKYVETCSSV